ncbi:hypothetical protein ACJQWK_11795 [Exserohilum turcicum]
MPSHGLSTVLVTLRSPRLTEPDGLHVLVRHATATGNDPTAYSTSLCIQQWIYVSKFSAKARKEGLDSEMTSGRIKNPPLAASIADWSIPAFLDMQGVLHA